MNSVLMILQPRAIPKAIESLEALPVDKAWFTAYTEEELTPILNKFIKDTSYDRYMLIADDVLVDPEPFQALCDLDPNFDCLTGWCYLASNDERVNLAKSPLTRSNGKYAKIGDYNLFTRSEVLAKPETFQTYLTGWVYSSAARDLWLKFPFTVNTYTKAQSDYEWSMKLQEANIKITAMRDCEIIHMKQRIDKPFKSDWLVGKQTPSVRLTKFRG